METELEKKRLDEDEPMPKTCRHPEHNPPMFIHIPEGECYKHVCPFCGTKTMVKNISF